MAERRTELVRAPAPLDRAAPWELTGLDRANWPLVIRGTWVFDAPLEAARLRESLARTLALYPHLAGRSVAGARVELTNEGVPFATAERSDLTVEQACAAPTLAGGFSLPLDVGRVRKGRDAPLAVLLTRLRDGCVLGVRVSHAVLDGHGFYGMVRTWSRLHAGRPFDPPLLDQVRMPQGTGRTRAETVRAATEAGWRKLRWLGAVTIVPLLLLGKLHQRAAAVHFAPGTLERLRASARREAGRDDLTTNDALSAHLTRMCLALHDVPAGTRCGQVVVVDLRERLAGLPATFAGNASFVVPTTEFRADAPLGELAASTHDALAGTFAGSPPAVERELVLTQDAMRHRLLLVPYDVAAAHQRRPTVVYLNSFARLPVYDIDFGEPGRPVRPVRVVPHDLPDPVLIWPAPPDVGGVEVYFTGRMAHALWRRSPDDPWWSELRRFERE
ncbi:MAG: hypothetical protein JXB32_23365 [Deltaproteobacteria bacterium]|nr:hypothetical protein [Deltaproteobacteria bacterium]